MALLKAVYLDRMLPLGNVIKEHSVNFSLFIQLYVSVEPNDPNALSALTVCLSGWEIIYQNEMERKRRFY